MWCVNALRCFQFNKIYLNDVPPKSIKKSVEESSFGAGEQATIEEVEKAVEVPHVEVAFGHRWVGDGWLGAAD